MNAKADVLASVAALIRSGLPAPITVSLAFRPYVTVHDSDLPRWVALMELPPPTWERVAGVEHARWPTGTFTDAPFELGACRLSAKAASR
jgi:hypothetical protein